MKLDLSIIIPLFNEEENVSSLINELNKYSKKLPKKTEIIFVNDGSSDQTAKKIKNTKIIYTKRIITLSKNFGHQSALLAGMKNSLGKMIVTMDGDLQHPVKIILEMIALNKKGYDVILTQKIDNNITSGFKKVSAAFFYKFVNFFSDTEIINAASDFRLLSRPVVDELLKLPEKRIFLRGLVNWIGFKKIIIPFEVQERKYGQSKYSLKKMLILAISGITSFSTLPLYIAGFTGFVMSIFSIIYGLYVVVQYLFNNTVSGWASLLVVLLIIGSGLFIFLGIIGIYLAAIYDEVKSRPNYIIEEIYNEQN